MADISIKCQFTGCDYEAQHASEAVAIAMLTSHNIVHQSSASAVFTKQKVPRIDRPELKQDINDEERYSFEAEWRRFKRCTDIRMAEVADQLFQCCDRRSSRLLLKENPDIIEAGEEALMAAMKKMAVIQIATSVRRTNLLVTKQEHGQSFREFYANVRAAAATCQYNEKCPHTCCATQEAVDYTSMVVKDILIAGIDDMEIRRDILSLSNLDSTSDKDILRFVEEKEIARNACPVNLSTASISSYNKSKRRPDTDPNLKKQLTMKGYYATCNIEINLFKTYRSGKLNKEPFKTCAACFKENQQKLLKTHNKSNIDNKKESSEMNAIISFIGALDCSNTDRMKQCNNNNISLSSEGSELGTINTVHLHLTLGLR